MTLLGQIREMTTPDTVALEVGVSHDEARNEYSLHSNRVESYEAFLELITRYYQHHYQRIYGHSIEYYESSERSKAIVSGQSGSLMLASEHAVTGRNGGMRVILDGISEHFKEESIRHYKHAVINHVVPENNWALKVQVVKELLQAVNATDALSENPERYASEYFSLLEHYLDTLDRTETQFQRL